MRWRKANQRKRKEREYHFVLHHKSGWPCYPEFRGEWVRYLLMYVPKHALTATIVYNGESIGGRVRHA